MDLAVRDLELLEAVGEHATLTAAAQAMFLSQPALSQRLLRLEDRLGSPLFDRRGRRLVPTAAGERMLRAARGVLRELRAAEHDVRRIGDGHRLPLRLATQCATNYQWLPPVMRAFRDREPDVDVQVEQVPDDDMIQALLDRRLDVGIVAKLDSRMDQVRLRPMFDDELVAVIAPTHPWASRAVVHADDFADVHLVLHDAYDPDRPAPVPLPLPHGARPGRLTTMPLPTDLLIDMILTGDRVSVLPSWTVAAHAAAGAVSTVHIDGPTQRRTWYCATRQEPTPKPLDALIEVLLDGTYTPANT